MSSKLVTTHAVENETSADVCRASLPCPTTSLSSPSAMLSGRRRRTWLLTPRPPWNWSESRKTTLSVSVRTSTGRAPEPRNRSPRIGQERVTTIGDGAPRVDHHRESRRGWTGRAPDRPGSAARCCPPETRAPCNRARRSTLGRWPDRATIRSRIGARREAENLLEENRFVRGLGFEELPTRTSGRARANRRLIRPGEGDSTRKRAAKLLFPLKLKDRFSRESATSRHGRVRQSGGGRDGADERNRPIRRSRPSRW